MTKTDVDKNDFEKLLRTKFFEERSKNEEDFYSEMKDMVNTLLSAKEDVERKYADGVRRKRRTKQEIQEEMKELMVSYLVSYPLLVNYFKCLPLMSRDCFVLGLFMVYGWMPRALRLNCGCEIDEKEFLRVRSFLLKIQSADTGRVMACLDGEGMATLEKLKRMTNNSVVGMSKVLHFVNPEVFPIYDSNIGSLSKNFSDVKNYVKYVKGFHGFCLNVEDAVNRFCRSEKMMDFKAAFGYDPEFSVAGVRMVELTLFNYARSPEFQKKLEDEKKEREEQKKTKEKELLRLAV